MDTRYIQDKADELIELLEELEIEGVKRGTFEWALSQLREGKNVRRERWVPDIYLTTSQFTMPSTQYEKMITYHVKNIEIRIFIPTFNEIFAEDWELA